MRTLADLQRLVTDYTILSYGPWDEASTARRAELARELGGRSHQSFAIQITELIIDAGVHRGESLR